MSTVNHDIILTSPKEIVHLEYNAATLSPRPSDEWTRFVCISDTHSRTFDVPDGDVLLHSGDLTNTGTVKDFQKTMEWLYNLPHKIKIIIAGNHDLPLHSPWYDTEYVGWHRKIGKQDINVIMEMLRGPRAAEAGIVYLQDEVYEFRTKENGKLWSVYGSPWSPEFFNWAFNYERETGEELVSKFPKTDILLTHGPAYQIFDRTNRGEDVGCEALRARLSDLRPRLHLAGHIHEAHGAHIHAWDTTAEPPSVQSGETLSYDNIHDPNLDHTVFVNAANWPAGERLYRDTSGRVKFGGLGFQPVVVDLKE
ncbi:Metallo-dependent phosphatase [Phlegmacium glaucopus]|nr:Metallo-dependent phosphatase [Phlegmacium glaucopus]